MAKAKKTTLDMIAFSFLKGAISSIIANKRLEAITS
jgi:hypothetical protein